VDEYELYIQPVIVGSGARLFPELETGQPLQLIEERTFSSGVILAYHKH